MARTLESIKVKMDSMELKEWFITLPQCSYCKLTIWPDTPEIIYYNEENSHKNCLEQAKVERIKELMVD